MMTLATSHTSAKAGSDLLMEEICRRVSGRVRPAEPAAVREVIALTHQGGSCIWLNDYQDYKRIASLMYMEPN